MSTRGPEEFESHKPDTIALVELDASQSPAPSGLLKFTLLECFSLGVCSVSLSDIYDKDYIAWSHGNLNVDNVFFWRTAEGATGRASSQSLASQFWRGVVSRLFFSEPSRSIAA